MERRDNEEIMGKREENQEEVQVPPGEEAGEELAARLRAKEEELEQCQEKVLRLAAELDNFKKRVEREKAEHMKFALEAFAKELLPFLDNLERAVQAARESRDLEGLLEGLELTLSGYFKTLERFGLKAFAAEGKRFDPSFHEALSVEENAEVDHNTVLKELLKGYTLHDRVLRPALVVVSKKPEGEGGQQETNA